MASPRWRTMLGLPLLSLAAIAAGPSSPTPRWQPPPQGAAEMFRQMPRAFRVGPFGAGGEPVRTIVAASPAAATVDMVVDLAPQNAWDLAEWPTVNRLAAGSVAFYRPGEWHAAFVGEVGQPIALPPGRYWLMGEAPGYVTAASNLIPVSPRGEKIRITFLAAVAPACLAELSPEADWSGIERLDVVSLDEGAVYPIAPHERRSLWVPAGKLLTYAVAGDRLRAVGDIVTCRPSEVVRIAPPQPPVPGRADLVLTLELPASYHVGERSLEAVLVVRGDEAPERRFLPVGAAWQGRRTTYFFSDLPDDLSLLPVVDDPSLRLPAAPPRRIRDVESLTISVAPS